ncbi:MAG TPA: 8-oxo-dGTP diphosphatase MutT [Actinobacteria bacterium]|nr:8-oxo-dGTP diphosphatase MutT [Actinomycetota bacterium]
MSAQLVVAAAIVDDLDAPTQLLAARRSAPSKYAGLWEFPGGKRHEGETLPDCLRREMQEELAVEVEVGQPVTVVKHAYTHFRITLHAYECQLLAGEPQAIGVADWRWATLEDLAAYAFAVTDQKIIAALNRQ